MLQRFLSDEARPLEPAGSVLPGGPSEGPAFDHLFMPRRFPLGSVILSAVAHVTVGYLLVSYSSYVARHPAEKTPDLNTARILELNMDLRPYVPRPQMQPPKPAPKYTPAQPAKAPQVPQLTAPQLKVPAPANPIPAPRDVRQYIPPPMQVADAPKVARAPETLIQLDIPKPEPQTQLQVPDALILTNSPRRFLPRPVIRPPDLPNKEIPAQVVIAMELPKIQDTAGDLPVAQLLTDHTALPIRPTSKAPVAGTAPAAAEAAKGNWKAEEAPALVAQPDNPIPSHTAVVVPPAVQIGTRGADSPPIQSGPPAQTGASGNGANTQTAANIKSPEASASTSATNGPARSPGAGPHPAAPLPEVAQIHLPQNGNYAVVVTQTSGLVPGSTDFLHGRPVYSVYVHAGARKDWILQYCLPGDATSRKSSTVVVSANSAPVAAPYAYTMLRPVLQFAAPGIRYAMIHGTINQNGKFEDLKEVGDRALRNMPELMQALSGWEFRPATKDGVPVAVEILLCIPNTNG